MRESNDLWSGTETWALPAWDFSIVREATDDLSHEVLNLVAVSRARTTPEVRRAIVARARDLGSPRHRDDASLREVVRRELVARGLFPAGRPIAGAELPVSEFEGVSDAEITEIYREVYRTRKTADE